MSEESVSSKVRRLRDTLLLVRNLVESEKFDFSKKEELYENCLAAEEILLSMDGNMATLPTDIRRLVEGNRDDIMDCLRELRRL